MSLQGNVLRFGADNTGVSDSSAAIQSAMDTDYAVFFPPGTYRLNSTVNINRGKAVECFGHSMVTGYIRPGESVAEVTERPGEQVRFVTDQNIDMFSLNAEQIHWFGGCFDFQGVTNHDGAAFYNPIVATADFPALRAKGEGCSIRDIVVLGDSNELRDLASGSTAGTKGVFFDFQNPSSIDNGYIAFAFVTGRFYGCNKAYYVTERNDTKSHWYNPLYYWIEAHDCRQAMDDRAVRNARGTCHHTAGPVFPSQAAADATPSIRIDLEDALFDNCKFFDFGDPSVGGYYYNEKTYQLGSDYAFYNATEDDLARTISRGTPLTWEQYNSHRSRGGQTILYSATQTELRDSSNVVNTNPAKRLGTMVWDTTNNILVVANGTGSTTGWRNAATAAIIHTPS